EGPHPGTDVLRAAGNGIESVPADDVVAGLADVDPVDMSFTREAQIVGPDFVLGEDAGGIGTDQKVISVELEAWPILIVVITELAGESGKQEVLSVVIRHQRVLMPVVKRVEQAVRVLL